MWASRRVAASSGRFFRDWLLILSGPGADFVLRLQRTYRNSDMTKGESKSQWAGGGVAQIGTSLPALKLSANCSERACIEQVFAKASEEKLAELEGMFIRALATPQTFLPGV